MTDSSSNPTDFAQFPDARGYFGHFGGRFVPETLMPGLYELEAAYEAAVADAGFRKELDDTLAHYVGRPSPLYFASRLTDHLGGPVVYLKREDINHTGAHKINNTVGQILLAQRMGKRRIIAETGAGQHGVAVATVAARQGLECIVYMGEEDVHRQAPNVSRMKLLGAEVRPVTSGSKTLKDATNEAIRDWVTNIHTTYYLIGSVVGPHPYPSIVRDFQAVIGREMREQMLSQAGALPTDIIACVGGGSNAIGIFHDFLNEREVKLIGVEAAGYGVDTDKHAASISRGRLGVLHGSSMMLLQDEDGQVTLPHSVSAGLDYPGVGPEHCFLNDTGRVEYGAATDDEALEAFHLLTRLEGIIPALESAHALAFLVRERDRWNRDSRVVVNLSGRGDKDLDMVMSLTSEGASANG